MTNYIFKNFPNACMLCVILASFFIFIFQLVSINASRDVKSDSISRIERDCAKLATEIKALQATKARLCNSELLRHNPGISEDLKEVPNEKIIRVRPHSIPYGTGRNTAPVPKALAIELTELAALAKHY